ncbi:MAG: glycosyltransferase family 2 protein, partial [Burkholderiales bacterium]
MTGLVAKACFWTAAGLLSYAYLVYPALVLAAARFRRISKEIPVGESWPQVAIVIAAYNEEKHIEARIRNLLGQDYPPERLTVYIGSDGSTDATAQVAASVADQRTVIRDYVPNRGKASVLNDLVGQATQEVIVFSDANTRFENDTVARLVAAFADPGVGAVCGELILTPPDQAGNQDHEYWSLERGLKAAESSIDGLLGANGGVYAIRRALYQPLRPDTICDDFLIVMNIAVAGQRVIYEPRARAHEETPGDMGAEFKRRVRIGIGNYQSLFRHPAFLISTNVARRWTYVSHKLLRWMTPHLLIIMLLASCVAAAQPPYALLLAMQLAAYAAAWTIYATRQ